MKTLYQALLLILAASLFTACNATPTPAAFPPLSQPIDTPQTLPVISATKPDSTTEPSPMPMPASEGLSQYAPQDGDATMMRGDLRIDSASVSLTKSQPPQVVLDMAYFKPTPCFQLRVEVAAPDAQGSIQVSAYGVAEQGKACTLMALATPLKTSLYLGSFPKGHYSLWLNGAKVGEFDL